MPTIQFDVSQEFYDYIEEQRVAQGFSTIEEYMEHSAKQDIIAAETAEIRTDYGDQILTLSQEQAAAIQAKTDEINALS